MKNRVITGSVIVVAVVLAILSKWLTPFVFDAFIGVVAVFACVEVARAAERMKKYSNITIASLYTPVAYLGLMLGMYFKLEFMWLILIILGTLFVMCILAYSIALIFRKNTTKEMEKYGYELGFARYSLDKAVNTLVVMIYPGLLFTVMFIMNHILGILPISNNNILSSSLLDWYFVCMIFAIAMFTDTFALVVGLTIKGPKLCPRISPKKTISGAIGGLVGGIVAAVIINVIFMTQPGFVTAFDYLKLNYWYVVFIGLAGSVFCQIGDLIASMVKRAARVKDYGTILPGHGGIMDRVDGLSFVGLFIFIFSLFFLI